MLPLWHQWCKLFSTWSSARWIMSPILLLSALCPQPPAELQRFHFPPSVKPPCLCTHSGLTFLGLGGVSHCLASLSRLDTMHPPEPINEYIDRFPKLNVFALVYPVSLPLPTLLLSQVINLPSGSLAPFVHVWPSHFGLGALSLPR